MFGLKICIKSLCLLPFSTVSEVENLFVTGSKNRDIRILSPVALALLSKEVLSSAPYLKVRPFLPTALEFTLKRRMRMPIVRLRPFPNYLFPFAPKFNFGDIVFLIIYQVKFTFIVVSIQIRKVSLVVVVCSQAHCPCFRQNLGLILLLNL